MDRLGGGRRNDLPCVEFLTRAGFAVKPVIERLRLAGAAAGNTEAWFKLVGVLLLAHAGLIVLVALAFGWPRMRASTAPAPAIARRPVTSPVVWYQSVCLWTGAVNDDRRRSRGPARVGRRCGAAAAFAGLAVIVFAGDSIELHHQRNLGMAWAGLLVAPAVLVPVAIVVLPWATGTELKVAQPAAAMGRFFADSFARRTGRPLAIVGGDQRLAELVAIGAPSRPHVYFEINPAPETRITADAVRRNGAVIVWQSPDTNPTPPPDIHERFPDLTPELPQAFARPVRSRCLRYASAGA